jgi:hypothetical protein
VSRKAGRFAGGHGTLDDGPPYVPSSSPIRNPRNELTTMTIGSVVWSDLGASIEIDETKPAPKWPPNAGSTLTSRQNARNEPTTMRIGPIVGILLASFRAAFVIKSRERTQDNADWMHGRAWSALGVETERTNPRTKNNRGSANDYPSAESKSSERTHDNEDWIGWRVVVRKSSTRSSPTTMTRTPTTASHPTGTPRSRPFGG